MTKEHRNKISLALKGRKLSPDHCRKMGLTKIGNKNMLGLHHSKETREKMSKSKKGMIWSAAVCLQRSLAKIGKPSFMLGKKHTLETRKKMSEARKNKNHWHWKGGITSLRREIRNCFEYKEWTQKCFIRDKYKCRDCGQVGGILHVHHVISFESIIRKYKIQTLLDAVSCALFWDINNGVVLCKTCHKIRHTKTK